MDGSGCGSVGRLAARHEKVNKPTTDHQIIEKIYTPVGHVIHAFI